MLFLDLFFQKNITFLYLIFDYTHAHMDREKDKGCLQAQH